MVLYYGLFALETANNTIAATASSSQRENLLKKVQPSKNMSSSSNSWIYTEDLRRHFEERYGDYRYIFVPVYIDEKNSRYNSSSAAIISQRSDGNNSWIYSRSLRDHLFNSTSKMSSSACCVRNQGFMRDEIPIKKPFFQRSSLLKDKSETSLLLPNSLKKHWRHDVVKEDDDDESAENENHSTPLIKHNSVIPLHVTTESSNGNSTVVNRTNKTKSNAKYAAIHHNRLTRIRSFFFKSSSSFSGPE